MMKKSIVRPETSQLAEKLLKSIRKKLEKLFL